MSLRNFRKRKMSNKHKQLEFFPVDHSKRKIDKSSVIEELREEEDSEQMKFPFYDEMEESYEQ